MSAVNRQREQQADEFEDPLSDYEPRSYESEVQRVLAEQAAGEIPSRPYISITPSCPIRDAVQAMHGSGDSIVLVVDEGRLLGVFTERDVLDRVAESFATLAHLPVDEVMTREPEVVYECDPSGTAVAAIAVAGHRQVPILDVEDHVLGVVNPQRVFRYLQENQTARV